MLMIGVLGALVHTSTKRDLRNFQRQDPDRSFCLVYGDRALFSGNQHHGGV